MAKTNGPLMSLAASGTYAGALTFATWKGRAYCRQRVDPSNPSTSGQVTTRLKLGSIAKAALGVLTSYADPAEVGSQFFIDARDTAPAGQSWISFLQKYASAIYASTISHWSELDGTEQGYFTTNAAAIGLTSYSPTLGGTPRTGLTAGQQLMALGFFGKNYLANAICSSAVDDASPSSGEVAALAGYVHTSTA